MKFAYSFRFKLSILYLITILVPTIVIVVMMPYYYKQIIIENSMSETDSIISSLKREVEAYFKDLEKLTLLPYTNDDVMNALKQKADPNNAQADPFTLLSTNKALATKMQNYMKVAREDIVGTTIIAKDNVLYANSFNGSDTVKDYQFATKDWYLKTLAGDGKVVFISPHRQDYLRNPPATDVFSVARVIKEPDTQSILGVIIADADTKLIRKIISEIRMKVMPTIAILDENNNPLYSTAVLSKDMLNQIAKQQVTVKGKDDSYIVIRKNLDLSHWNIVALISNSAIQAQFKWVYLIGILFGLGGLILTIVVFFSLSRWIINPFKQMISLMKTVQRGKFNAQMEVRGKDEIAQLGTALNSMISHLNEMIDNEYRAQLNLRNAELKSLQAQLQPHFLYNVLNGFIGLNRLGQKETLEHAIISLSKMLRYILVQTDTLTIKDEFDFLKNYCDLQKMRFSKKGFEFEIVCDPAMETLLFPKLLLQPLVENSIIHGIEPINRACLLRVTANKVNSEVDSYIEIIVEDNGAGFEQTIPDSPHQIGLENVQERLRLAFQKTSFSMESTINTGTKTVIRIWAQEVRV
jgi:two-component system sensor histidine kinase YesM